MATKTAARRRRPNTTAKPRPGRTQTPTLAPAPAGPEAATLQLVHPEADAVAADADDRAADLLDLAAADAQRIIAEGESRAQDLVTGANTEAAAITEAATAERDRILAGAEHAADQVRAQAAVTAAADADQVLAEARRQSDAVTTAAATEAAAVVTAAGQDAAKVLADAERTATGSRTRAAADADQVLARARAEADRMRASADTHAAEVRGAAERAAAGIRQDADRALDDARSSADSLRAVVDKDVARLREQAASDTRTARDAAAKVADDLAAAAQAREEAERLLTEASRRTVQRARRREIRQESRARRRKARLDARPAGGVPPLSGSELVGVVAVVLAAAAVSTLGLLSSYTALENAALGWGWSWPWLLPVGIDVSIPAFTGVSLLLIRMGMELRWIRWAPRALTFGTVYLNWEAGSSLAGQIGHAFLTLLWVVFSEVAAHVYATRIGAVTGKKRMETVRRSRWLLAPLPTARLRRRMILWEITSYDEALARLQEQTWMRARLRETYGWRWRSKAPLPDRMTLKLGTIPAALANTLTPSPDAHAIERTERSGDAHPEPSATPALTSGNARSERKRPALAAGAHTVVSATVADGAHRAEPTRKRSDTDALTERRHERIRLLYTELGRRPEWTEIRDALTDAGLSETPVSRPTAQRLRAQVEEGTPSAPVSAGASA